MNISDFSPPGATPQVAWWTRDISCRGVPTLPTASTAPWTTACGSLASAGEDGDCALAALVGGMAGNVGGAGVRWINGAVVGEATWVSCNGGSRVHCRTGAECWGASSPRPDSAEMDGGDAAVFTAKGRVGLRGGASAPDRDSDEVMTTARCTSGPLV